jgi:DMSO reductase family type II enzyme chaperone
MYANLGSAFGFPGEEILGAIEDGKLSGHFHQLLSSIHGPVGNDIDWEALGGRQAAGTDLQVEFTRLFEAGEGGPPCPLLESHYRGAELGNLEELVRYYEFFGLSLPDDRQVRPDHLTTQLDFLHFLAFNEAEATDEPEAAVALARAQRDFIRRHTGAWIPLLREALARQSAAPYFLELARMLERFIGAEMDHLDRRLDPA